MPEEQIESYLNLNQRVQAVMSSKLVTKPGLARPGERLVDVGRRHSALVRADGALAQPERARGHRDTTAGIAAG